MVVILTREQVLGCKPARKTLEVPEWGGAITIQALTYGAAEKLSKDGSGVDLVIAAVINEDGSPMFSPEDREALSRQELQAVSRIATAVNEMSGKTKEAQEQLAKNSETGLNGDSSSDSP